MSEEVNWNIMGDNREIRVFTIPVGNLDRKESEKLIQEIMNKYKEYSYGDYWPSIKEENIVDNHFGNDGKDLDADYHYITKEEIWNELTDGEKKERQLSKEEQNEIFKKTGFVDWNQYDLDYLVEYLENKWKYNSSGEALAIFKLIDFYKTHIEKYK